MADLAGDNNTDTFTGGDEDGTIIGNVWYLDLEPDLAPQQSALITASVTITTPWNGSSGNDEHDGDENDNGIFGYGGDDVLNGNGGNDVISGGDGDDEIDGGAGDDILSGGAGADTIVGGPGDNTLYSDVQSASHGTPFQDFAFTAPTLDKGTEVDTLTGGADSDLFYAGYGDIVDGGEDFDRLILSLAGSPTGVTFNWDGSAHQGTLDYGAGSITDVSILRWLEGSEFDDTISVTDFVNGGMPIFGLGGNDTIETWDSVGNVYGGDGNDTITHGRNSLGWTFGGNGHDILNGSPDDDVLLGEAGNDELNGGFGDDTLNGGTGLDELDGGEGQDLLLLGEGTFVANGGGGADTFRLTSLDGVEAGGVFIGRIDDFSTIDTLDLSQIMVGGAPLDYIGDAEFSGTAGEVRFDDSRFTSNPFSGSGFVQIDSDGDGAVDVEIQLSNVSLIEETADGSNMFTEVFRNDISGFQQTSVRSTFDNDLVRADTARTVFASAGNDLIIGAGSGASNVRLTFDLSDTDLFGFFNDPRTILLLQDKVIGTGGINTRFDEFGLVSIAVDGTGTFDLVDASAWIPGNASRVLVTLGEQSLAGVERAIGSQFNDIFIVREGVSEVDGGAGSDSVTYSVRIDNGEQVVVTGDATSFQLTHGSLLNVTGTGVEVVAINGTGSSSRDVGFSLDASQSPVRIATLATFVSDTIIGSNFDDDFTFFGTPTDPQPDTVRGNGGSDYFDFGFGGAHGTNLLTIEDFEIFDVINVGFNSGVNVFDGGLIETFIGTDPFSGTAGEFRYEKLNGETLLTFDFDGNGSANSTLTIANGEFDLSLQTSEGAGGTFLNLTIAGPISGTENADIINGRFIQDEILGLDGGDIINAARGDDIIDGGSNIDTAIFSGDFADSTITQTSTGVFEIVGADGTDTLTNIEFAQFDDQTIRLLNGTGVSVNFNTADPSEYQSAMNAIRDFDGNTLGGDGNWLRIGEADVNGDGDIDQILVNDSIARFATVGTAEDGLTYFDDHGWAGETRVAGIYIDPLVASGDVVAGSPFDSQQRFMNDLAIENINRVLGADDYDGDGLQEVYFALTDGTAYLHAYMHADGNIQYANYQSEQQVIDFLESNGFGVETYGDWFA